MIKYIKINKAGAIINQFPFMKVTVGFSFFTMLCLVMNESWSFCSYGSLGLLMSNLLFFLFLSKNNAFVGNISNLTKLCLTTSLLINATAAYLNFSYNKHKKNFFIDWFKRRQSIILYKSSQNQVPNNITLNIPGEVKA